MNSRTNLQRKVLAQRELNRRKSLRRTVYGIVDPDKGLTHALTTTKMGKWIDSQDSIDVYIAAKQERILTSKKRFIVIIGGRGSAKSVGITDICVADTRDNKSKTYFLREFQSSIKNSVHSLVSAEIKRFGFTGFNIQKQSIEYKDKQAFEFAGLSRNVDSVKSTHGFRRFVVEESQFISQGSLDALTPTVRNKPKPGLPSKFLNPATDNELRNDIAKTAKNDNVSIIFIANPGSSNDPFSKRFIEPFKTTLDRDGVYEDDLHLIVQMNYPDNPWYEDSGLEGERLWDLEHRSRAFYDHQWLGEYNDSVDDSIIKPEWFDAAIDAHKTLKFSPRGQKVVTHDPSDSGDAKALSYKHGSVVLDVRENTDDDVNDGCDWALDYAIDVKADLFRWDCDGLGISLKRQVDSALNGKAIQWQMFRGSEMCEDPKSTYMPVIGERGASCNKDVWKNKRAQCAGRLRDKFYNTYRAVIKGDYVDPDHMISISSDIESMHKLRSEVCRIPEVKNGSGLFQIMSKPDMKKKHGLESPNMFDCLMMGEAQGIQNNASVESIPVSTKYIY